MAADEALDYSPASAAGRPARRSAAILPWLIAGIAVAAAAAAWIWALRRVGAHETEQAGAVAGRAAEAAVGAELRREAGAMQERMDRVRADLERLAGLTDALPIPLWRRDEAMAITDCNRAYAEMAESDRETVVAESRELGGKAARARMQRLARLAQAAGTVKSEKLHLISGGMRRLYEVSEMPLPDGGSVGVAVDITAQEEAASELARHVSAHGDVLENLATGIAIWSSDRRLAFFNSAFARMWRLEESWLETKPTLGELLELLRERRHLPEHADFPAFKQGRMQLFTHLIEPIEELAYVPDGTTIRTRICPHPLGGLLFTFEDVTDTLALERSYNTLIAVQRETLDHLYEGVAVIGTDGRLKLSNPVYARMWRLPPEMLAAEPHVAEIVERGRELFLHEGPWSAAKERIIARMGDRSAHRGRATRSDGTTLDYAIVPLPDGNTLLSYVDVSDSIRVERALRDRTEALETADRLKSEFIASVSYELRTPLNTVLGFAQLLDRQYFGTLNPRQLEYARGIIESSERLSTFIGDILDLAMIEAGRLVLEREPVSLAALLDGVRLVAADLAAKAGLKLLVDAPPAAERIHADPRRLKQALYNLVSNAIRFSPAGGTVRLAARIEGGQAVLTVTDSGSGERSGDPRRELQGGPRRPDGGRRGDAGLGLALVKNLVELHGGAVSMTSDADAGTVVTVMLPLGTEAEAQPLRQAG